MSEQLANMVAHYLEVIVDRAGLTGFDEMRAEIMSAAEADERILREHLKREMAVKSMASSDSMRRYGR